MEERKGVPAEGRGGFAAGGDSGEAAGNALCPVCTGDMPVDYARYSDLVRDFVCDACYSRIDSDVTGYLRLAARVKALLAVRRESTMATVGE